MKLIRVHIITALFIPWISSAFLPSKNSEAPLFTRLPESHTGVSFINTIKENDSLNVLKYEYLYNGAGVGIGDFNKDGLQDIFFSSNTASNKLFLNTGNFQFKDITGESAVKGNGTWSTGVSIADVNGDGWTDIYVCHSGKFQDPRKLSNELFINQGIKNNLPVFKEMAKEYGLDAPGTQSTQAAFLDYDKDGDLDMFLLNHSNHTYNPLLNTRKVRSTPHPGFGNRFFKNESDGKGTVKFRDITMEAGIVNHALNYGLSVNVSDLDGDGWPDIYTTSDYSEKDCFYVNNRKGGFTEKLEKSFAHISKYSMGADIADYNNDERPDVFTLDMLPEDNHRQKLLKGPDEYDQYHLLLDSGYYHQQMRNMLHLNQGTDDQGNLRFSEIGQLAGVSNTDWSWSGLFSDFDNDGWKDLLVTNGYLRDYTDLDFLKYTVADAKVQAAKQGHQNFQTYALVSKMPSNKLRNYVYQNNHNLSFSDKSVDWGLKELGVSNAAAYADFDNDGDMDLVICNNNDPAFIYRNNQNQVAKNHFVKIRLSGAKENQLAFGARVVVATSDGNRQLQEVYPVRGYQSSVSTELLFGYPSTVSLREISVIWPSGKITAVDKLVPDTIYQLDEAHANASFSRNREPRLFTDITSIIGLPFVHKENDFIDFKQEVLLPYQLSRQGPPLAKADVNGDGLDDLFIGGAIGQAGKLLIQRADGKFLPAHFQPWEVDAESEDVNVLFFDADKDRDPDLYVVSGGNEYGDLSPEYQDRLYINDGNGNFSRQAAALPSMLSNKQAIASGDVDHDGDLDLFIGGRGVAGSFPLTSKSYLLRNDSRDGLIKFTDVTEELAPALRLPGMVTVASWQDLDHDQFPELFIAGDWMPLMIFKNNKGQLTDISATAGLKGTAGMWSALLPADVDEDGDVDFLLGNCGLNTPFKASPVEPMRIYVADIDNNGVNDPVLTYYIQGKEYPMASRDELLDQVPALRKKFIKYADYADATVKDIYPKQLLQIATVYRCEELASGILYNQGNLNFSFKPFPLIAQGSKVNTIIYNNINADGKKDILLAGNFYPYRVQSGRCDASLGVFLRAIGKGAFEPVDPAISGCYIGGDVRTMVEIKNKNGDKLLVVSKNNDALQILKVY